MAAAKIGTGTAAPMDFVQNQGKLVMVDGTMMLTWNWMMKEMKLLKIIRLKVRMVVTEGDGMLKTQISTYLKLKQQL